MEASMVILIVHVHVKSEHIDAFREATIENARNSRQEPGIVRFDLLQQADDASRFVLYEVYRSPEAPPQHRETAHYKTWLARVTDMLAGDRTRVFYSNVFPSDAEW
ncbi:MAG: antibiotic biosynthesis monooxygenase [Terriglobia bacterium]|nr:MAG: antibiotic biosynthesis monooxygenase [Terriglobia bacterium]